MHNHYYPKIKTKNFVKILGSYPIDAHMCCVEVCYY